MYLGEVYSLEAAVLNLNHVIAMKGRSELCCLMVSEDDEISCIRHAQYQGYRKGTAHPVQRAGGTRYVASRIVLVAILAVQPGGGSNIGLCLGCFSPFIMSRLRQHGHENPVAMIWPLKRAISHFTTLVCGVSKCAGMQGDDGRHEKRGRVFTSRVEPGHQMRAGMVLQPYIGLPLAKT